MNTGGGNSALHYSDLNSPSNVSSAKMPKDNGRGQVALRYSQLYSHESDHSAGNPNGQWQWKYLLPKRRGYIS